MPAPKQKKHNVLKTGFFMKGDSRFDLQKKYKNKSEAEKHIKKIRNEGYLGELSEYSPKKHQLPFLVFKGPKGKARGGGGRTGTRKTNYRQKYLKTKGELKTLARDFAELSLPVSKSEEKRIRTISRNYKSKKKLTPTQKKRLTSIKKTLKEIKMVNRRDFELKMQMKSKRVEIKNVKAKMKEEAEKKA